MILAVQARLGVEVDGKAGPQTWSAIYRKIVGTLDEPQGQPLVDERSEENIATLHPRVRPMARALVHACEDQGFRIKVIDGTRTYAEQDALYAKGRTADGRIVTNARGGFSNHNFGLAFDIGVFEQNEYVPESPLYKVAGALGKTLGLEWGGDWHSIVDEPHYQLRPSWATNLDDSAFLSELRNRASVGVDPFTV